MSVVFDSSSFASRCVQHLRFSFRRSSLARALPKNEFVLVLHLFVLLQKLVVMNHAPNWAFCRQALLLRLSLALASNLAGWFSPRNVHFASSQHREALRGTKDEKRERWEYLYLYSSGFVAVAKERSSQSGTKHQWDVSKVPFLLCMPQWYFSQYSYLQRPDEVEIPSF